MSFLETAESAVGSFWGATGAKPAAGVASARMAMGSFIVGEKMAGAHKRR